MLHLHDRGPRLCDGLSRREWLRVGGLSLGGLTLADLISARQAGANPQRAAGASGSFGRAKRAIVIAFLGGPPQHDTWDPKPNAPAEVRGEFGAIPSKTPGLFVGELMPRLAQHTDKFAVLRAVVTGDNAHSTSGYQMLTGVPHVPMNIENARPGGFPNNAPNMGSVMRALRPAPGRLPSAVTIPEGIWNTGMIPWPGQDAGYLGRQRNPWLVQCDPSSHGFDIAELKLQEAIAANRFDDRRRLLDQVNASLDSVERSGAVERFQPHAQTAFDLLSASKSRGAFDLSQESEATRDRYGRSRWAQSLLLARRLVEADVSLVQIYWTRIADRPNDGGWDTHATHNFALKSFLMPMMDQGVTALIEDLEERGLLDSTLVYWMGEFGHTPKFNANAGRDHWGHCFSVAMAGGGIRGGVVHGASDAHAAFPVDGVVRAPDLLATMFHCLGYEPETTVADTVGRPVPIARGQVIEQIV